MKKQSFFEKRSVVAIFGIVALIAGIYFVSPFITGNVTGNIIYSNYFQTNITSFIGILLLICSVILIVHAVTKRD